MIEFDFWLFSALFLGIVGELHCLGMCGPLILLHAQKSTPDLITKSIYHISRIFVYVIMGVIVGFFSKGISIFIHQQTLSIISGIIMLLVILLPIIGHPFKLHLFGNALLNFPLKFKISNNIIKVVVLGIINGLLPCGLVYTALAGALASGNPINGALYMLLFGLGTTPLLLLVTMIFGKKLQLFGKSKFVFLSIFVAILLIVRGLNLGIPYLSPYMDQEISTNQPNQVHAPKCH